MWIGKLHDFFLKMKQQQCDFNKTEMLKQKYGFAVYNRKAFDQRKKHNKDAIINFFNNEDRKQLEDAVLQYV